MRATNEHHPPLFTAAPLLGGCTQSGTDGGLGTDPAAATTSAPTPAAETREAASVGVTVDIVIKDGKVTPRGKRVVVEVGQKVSRHVDSDAAEQIHVHSDPEHSYEVAPGDDKTFIFWDDADVWPSRPITSTRRSRSSSSVPDPGLPPDPWPRRVDRPAGLRVAQP